jgi:hypothetical protein
MSEASKYQLSITTQTHINKEPEPSTLPKPQTGAYLYVLNGNDVSISKVKYGNLDDANKT